MIQVGVNPSSGLIPLRPTGLKPTKYQPHVVKLSGYSSSGSSLGVTVLKSVRTKITWDNIFQNLGLRVSLAPENTSPILLF